MASKVSNNAATTIAGSINSVVATINLAAGTGALFPTLSGSDWFYGTLIDASNNLEIVKVTARATDAITVTRGQDGTTARSYTVGDRFELRPTAALFNDKADLASPTFTGTVTIPTAAVTTLSLGGTTITPTATELNYVDGVTSSIQTQLNGKATMAAGTVCLFYQASAPTGWTQVITQNNKALRVVSGTGAGTGGSVAFTTAFASQSVAGTVGGTALTEAQLPSHRHGIKVTENGTGGGGGAGAFVASGGSGTGNTEYSGSGQTHTHTFTGTAINLAVQYIDVIIASRN